MIGAEEAAESIGSSSARAAGVRRSREKSATATELLQESGDSGVDSERGKPRLGKRALGTQRAESLKTPNLGALRDRKAETGALLR